MRTPRINGLLINGEHNAHPGHAKSYQQSVREKPALSHQVSISERKWYLHAHVGR
jgi:hypothetical protein